jgi:hypothetical protein
VGLAPRWSTVRRSSRRPAPGRAAPEVAVQRRWPRIGRRPGSASLRSLVAVQHRQARTRRRPSLGSKDQALRIAHARRASLGALEARHTVSIERTDCRYMRSLLVGHTEQRMEMKSGHWRSESLNADGQAARMGKHEPAANRGTQNTHSVHWASCQIGTRAAGTMSVLAFRPSSLAPASCGEPRAPALWHARIALVGTVPSQVLATKEARDRPDGDVAAGCRVPVQSIPRLRSSGQRVTCLYSARMLHLLEQVVKGVSPQRTAECYGASSSTCLAS